MIMAVTLRMAARMVVRVGMAWSMGVGVHRYLFYSTSLAPRAHPEVSSCYWKL